MVSADHEARCVTLGVQAVALRMCRWHVTPLTRRGGQARASARKGCRTAPSIAVEDQPVSRPGGPRAGSGSPARGPAALRLLRTRSSPMLRKGRGRRSGLIECAWSAPCCVPRPPVRLQWQTVNRTTRGGSKRWTAWTSTTVAGIPTSQVSPGFSAVSAGSVRKISHRGPRVLEAHSGRHLMFSAPAAPASSTGEDPADQTSAADATLSRPGPRRRARTSGKPPRSASRRRQRPRRPRRTTPGLPP